MGDKNIKNMSNDELLNAYNEVRSKIDGVIGYNMVEVNYMEELIREMDKREE